MDEVDKFFDKMENDIRQEKGAQIESISRNFKDYEIDVILVSLNTYKKSLVKEKKKLEKKPKTIYVDLLIKIDSQINLVDKLYQNFNIGASLHIGEDKEDTGFKIIEGE